MLYRTAKLIKDQIKHCKGMSLYPVSVNDIDLATAKLILPTDVYLFLRWVITNDQVEEDLESSCSIAADERRVLCLAQDLIHCASRTRWSSHVCAPYDWIKAAGIHSQSNRTLLVLWRDRERGYRPSEGHLGQITGLWYCYTIQHITRCVYPVCSR